VSLDFMKTSLEFYNKTYRNFIIASRGRKNLKTQYQQQKNAIAILKQNNPRFFGPEKLLDDCDTSVRQCLAKILGTKNTSSSKLIERLCSLSQSILDKALFAQPRYEDVIKTVCSKLSLPRPELPYQGEQSIAVYCFKEMYQKLSPSQQKEYENALRQQAKSLKHLNPSLTPSMISVGAIIAGRMSGFGVYLAASTLVGSITSTIGVTLPFVFYTTMSSAISIFLGPIGWAVAGAMVIDALFPPKVSKVTQGIILIASLRAEKELEWEASCCRAKEQLKITFEKIQSNDRKIIYLGLVLLSYWLIVPALILLIMTFIIR
jgi:hypothetical protein